MAPKIPDEVQLAKQSIEAACASLESLFKQLQVMPRADKVIVSDTVHEACLRLQAAKELLARLEVVSPALDGPAASIDVTNDETLAGEQREGR